MVPDHFNDPRRFELIERFIENSPRRYICTTPFMSVDAEAAPEAFRRIKARWLTLLADAPTDTQIVRGAAAFVASESLDEAARLLKTALVQQPDNARLWADLGRMSQAPHERLAAFEKARDAGETSPNLLVWIATTSFEAGDYEKAERAAGDLMQLVDEARARFGDQLDWPERGRALWMRAREACKNNAEAGEVTDAVAQHAYRKHWANTVLGLLACRNDDLDRAVSYLRASADARPRASTVVVRPLSGPRA